MPLERKQDPHGPLEMFVVYQHPLDFPDHFVVRRWEVGAGAATPTRDFALADSLDAIRGEVPVGLYRLERDPRDEPQIVEMWL